MMEEALQAQRTRGRKDHSKLHLKVYVVVWALLLFAATFPFVILNNDFKFLEEGNFPHMPCIFSLTMIIALHLCDTAYVVISNPDIENERLRKGFISNLVFLALAAIFLMLFSAHPSFTGRRFFFLTFWLALICIKYYSMQMTLPTTVNLTKV